MATKKIASSKQVSGTKAGKATGSTGGKTRKVTSGRGHTEVIRRAVGG